MWIRTLLILAVGYGASTAPAVAEVTLNPVFSDGMVLQHGTTVPVFGRANPGDEVTVTFEGQSASTYVDQDAKWQVELKDLAIGGPFEMTVACDDQTIVIGDVLVGEVWICSGQSNMQWPVNRSADPEKVAAESADGMLRLLTVPRIARSKPQETADVSWTAASPESVPDFSAVAYHFGAKLREELDVPIGLISTNYGGTPAEAWTNLSALKADESLAPLFEMTQNRDQNRPAWLYNAMINPLIPYAFKGAIWYQGESNASRAYQYRTLFPTMIQSWRDAWKIGDFPFLFVQLAPWRAIKEEPAESDWAELREAQTMTLDKLPNTGMAVITDVGNEQDIHPKQKQPVGDRLALAALAIAYDKDICYSGPMYKDATFADGKATITFDHLCGGLVARDGPLTGFTIAGEDRKFVTAQAEIVGETVVVQAEAVSEPVAVRFGWADYPVVNLWNEGGLPASPFRTDDWPGITEPK